MSRLFYCVVFLGGALAAVILLWPQDAVTQVRAPRSFQTQIGGVVRAIKQSEERETSVAPMSPPAPTR